MGKQDKMDYWNTVPKNNLRYDFMNSYLQHNYNCNQQKSGDASNYEKGLIVRFGKEEGRKIISYCEENNKPLKLSWQDIEALRVNFNNEIRKIQTDLS